MSSLGKGFELDPGIRRNLIKRKMQAILYKRNIFANTRENRDVYVNSGVVKLLNVVVPRVESETAFNQERCIWDQQRIAIQVQQQWQTICKSLHRKGRRTLLQTGRGSWEGYSTLSLWLYWLSCFQEKRGLYFLVELFWASQVAQQKRNLPTYAKDAGSIPGSERIPGGRNNSPLQYSCLENSMDREARRLSPRVTKGSDKKQANNRQHHCRGCELPLLVT